MSIHEIKNAIRNVPDFPKAGIQFKDITTALKKPVMFQEIIDLLAHHYRDKKIDCVVGIEARGFILGAPLAYCLGCGFVPIRKKGKLPAKTLSQEYALEYGSDKIEIHQDALTSSDRVLLVDDLLATSGTAAAAANLIQQTGAELVGIAFMIELLDLNGREKLEQIAPVFSLIQY